MEGIFTHFANADAPDLTPPGCSWSASARCCALRRARRRRRPLRHAANSGAILQLPESHLDLVRPGILFYGAGPSAEVAATIPVRQALAWMSRVVFFKVVEPGHPVSYGSTWQTDHPGGHPAGGLRRRLRPRDVRRPEVIIRGKRYPVVGRICMDQMMVYIGWDTAYNGDEVVLLGEDGDEQRSPSRSWPPGPAPSPTRS